MKHVAKIDLSDAELRFVQDPDIIPLKFGVIEKLCQMFSLLAEKQSIVLSDLENKLPGEFVKSVPKITRGENYLQNPYVILDYPAVFSKGNVMAIRTMFWWGNYFSVTLHVSGSYKKDFLEAILNNLPLQQGELYIGVNAGEWHHHFEKSNYISIKETGAELFKKIFEEKDFIKLAVKHSLSGWNQVLPKLEKSTTSLIELLIP